MRPNRDLSFVVTNELAVQPVVTNFTITFLYFGKLQMEGNFNALSSLCGRCTATLKRPSCGLTVLNYRIKLTFIFIKSAMRHSQGSVRAPHGLENHCALDAQSVNVYRKVVDFRLVRKPFYGPRPLILDLTTSTVEANTLRHPHCDVAIAMVFSRKQTARRTDALCDQRFRYCCFHIGMSVAATEESTGGEF